MGNLKGKRPFEFIKVPLEIVRLDLDVENLFNISTMNPIVQNLSGSFSAGDDTTKLGGVMVINRNCMN